MAKSLDDPRVPHTQPGVTGRLRILDCADDQAWNAQLSRSGAYDFYHSGAYHRLAEANGEGSARLVSYECDGQSVALPLLLRDFVLQGRSYRDVTSVYGYAGPVGPPALPAQIRDDFGQALTRWLGEEGVVSLFSRLHPLLPSQALIANLGQTPVQGPTVSIDLAIESAARRAAYRSNHRRDLRKLRSRGFSCRLEHSPAAIDEFAALYLETMSRVHSEQSYRFTRAYIAALLDVPGVELMLCRDGDRVCAGAVLSFVGAVAQYHLGGTHDAWLRDSPMKLIFDEACEAGSAHGCRRLHLGGGLGAREDALFAFKAGFSSDRHDFRTWRWIVDPTTYRQLCEGAGVDAKSAHAFPAYR